MGPRQAFNRGKFVGRRKKALRNSSMLRHASTVVWESCCTGSGVQTNIRDPQHGLLACIRPPVDLWEAPWRAWQPGWGTLCSVCCTHCGRCSCPCRASRCISSCLVAYIAMHFNDIHCFFVGPTRNLGKPGGGGLSESLVKESWKVH